MKNIIFYQESSDEEHIIPQTIAKLYLNRLTINEDDANEVLGFYETKQLWRKGSEGNLYMSKFFEGMIIINFYESKF